jgi:hypothetical protein
MGDIVFSMINIVMYMELRLHTMSSWQAESEIMCCWLILFAQFTDIYEGLTEILISIADLNNFHIRSYVNQQHSIIMRFPISIKASEPSIVANR